MITKSSFLIIMRMDIQSKNDKWNLICRMNMDDRKYIPNMDEINMNHISSYLQNISLGIFMILVDCISKDLVYLSVQNL